MAPTLSTHDIEIWCARLQPPKGRAPQSFQPLHTVYGGAHLFTAQTTPKLTALAQGSVREESAASFARALGLPGWAVLPDQVDDAQDDMLAPPPGEVARAAWLAHHVFAAVRRRLAAEAIADF